MGRVGKVAGSKPRPVRVAIEEVDDKRKILNRAKLLKENSKYDKIYVCPDLTKKQQDEDKKLRDKVREFRNQGMVGVKIVRGEVVKEEAGSRVVLFGGDA